MTPPRPSGVLRWLQSQPQHVVAVLALLIALLLCALVAKDLVRDRGQQLAAAQSKTSGLTHLLEEHTRQTMRRVELSLSLAAQELQAQYLRQGRISPANGPSLRAFLPQDGLIASFAVLDKSGKILASTLTDAPNVLPLANDRDFFMAQQSPAQNGLFVGQAVKSRISGLWIIPVSIKLASGFSGYLMGAVDPEYFQRLYRAIDGGDDASVTLFTKQGWAIASWPLRPELAQRNRLDMPLIAQDIAQAPVDSVRVAYAFGATPSLVSYRALQDYPLVVTMALPQEHLLSSWRTRAWREAAALLLLLLFLGGSTWLLMVQLRRRVRAEWTLKLSEISLFKSSLPTLWIGSDARVLRVNQAACDLHGYTEEEMCALRIFDLNPGMSPERWPAHWQKLRSQHNLRFETTHRDRQGVDVPVEAELNFIEFEGQEYNFAFLRDLSERKQAEAEVQRSTSMLRGAIDAVDEAFVLFDAEDRLVYCNAKYIQLYPDLEDLLVPGVRFEELVRIGAKRGLYRESVGREEEWISERLQAHRQGNATRVQKRDDGRVLRVIDRKTPDSNIVGIRVDITDMVRATEEAQEASRYKSQFLANMSHEIRTPMNAILGLLSLLQNTDLSEVQRDYASKTFSAAQSLLGLLNDILDFSKVEAGKMELDPQAFRLDRMLRDIAVILGSNLEGKAIEVLFDIAPGVPSVVVGDAMRLQQVLVNLASNAIKFTAQGQVVLRVQGLPQSGDADRDRALLEFVIQDSGIGIAHDKQEHIFTGFSQAEASTTRRFGGTGLGLAICKRLVELMGGELSLQSEPGVGSIFSFSLLLPLAGKVSDGGGEAARLSVQPKRVLVVDDNRVARDILSAITRSWGWPTTLAASGQQALELLDAGQPFDLIYLDWQMPGMDGWELVRQIRQRGLTLRPRLVMLSANGGDSLSQRTPQEHDMLDGFLFKPVTASALQDAALGRSAGDVRLKARRGGSRQLAGLRILVVEDNLINQQVAQELLHAEGALVSLAANGQLGVAAVAAPGPPFDVVLMDIQMPVLDGYGATRKIREELGLTALPIVAMTANAMASDRQACLEAGMNDHVGKPFDMGYLVSVLLRVTGHAVAAAPTALQSTDPQPVVRQPALADRPYLDVAIAVERLSGLVELYGDLLQDFMQALVAVEGEFTQATQAGDFKTLSAQMHTLKGTAATLGAMPLSEHAAKLEQKFRNPPQNLVALDELPGLLALVQSTTLAARAAVPGLRATAVARVTATSAGDRAQARELLQGLTELLQVGDLSSLDLFAQQRDALDALSADEVAELHQALQALDLELARQLCERHIASLADH